MSSLLPSHLNNNHHFENICNFTLNVRTLLHPHPHPPINTTTDTNANTDTSNPKFITINLASSIKLIHWSNHHTIHKLSIPFPTQLKISKSIMITDFADENDCAAIDIVSAMFLSTEVGCLMQDQTRNSIVSKLVAAIRSYILMSYEAMILNRNLDICFEVELITMRDAYYPSLNKKVMMMKDDVDVDVGVESGHNKNCIICFDELDAKTEVCLPCGHKLFHKKCILSWFKTKDSCPLCRHRLVSSV
ncbi:Zinc finger RING/FYVE/PHD-type protein [Dioscorea alata]|uniref:Zinc finger RING/FYVE/PHD-type protein n=1 Tax=Dioscorea alata TaxID=55571 RepID=A0ACB7VEW7_DIOAL|nr:Zinc finger RING/FYVE/PHD-type protein [Dioscorea alata]